MSVKRLAHPSPGDPVARLQICIAYDRLYPYSIGGVERWYRRLAERLAADGHQVTYLTTRQWPSGEVPCLSRVDVVAIADDDALYSRGRRRVKPLLRFGLALWWHLVRHGGSYDVVHTSGMSSWNALAAGSLARVQRYRLVLDWWEVWTWFYWRRYLGAIAGTMGWFIQCLTTKLPHAPLAYSTLHAARLAKLKGWREIPVAAGGLASAELVDSPCRADLLLVYAGRFIPEKQIPAIVRALAEARRRLPALEAVLIGDGPDDQAVRDATRATRLESYIRLPGFVSEEVLAETLGRALCLVLLSRREGYGLIVAEAAALGVPSVVLRHPDSAAAELVVDGVNGFTCASTDPQEVASAILRVHDAGDALRQSTLAWFGARADSLTIEGLLPNVLNVYRGITPVADRTDA